MRFPTPPASDDPKELHRYIMSLHQLLELIVREGIQATFFEQSTINDMTALTQAGKMVFNQDTGRFNFFEESGGSIVVKTLP